MSGKNENIARKKRILHVINSLEPEGAQILLLNTLQLIDLKKYEVSLAYLHKYPTALKKICLPGSVQIYDLGSRGKFSLFSLIRLIRLIRQHKIDIVHTHLVQAGILGRVAARIARVKHIVTTRHYGYNPKEETLLFRLEERLTAWASVVIVVSEAVKQYLLERKVLPEKQMIVIHNGINLKIFDSERLKPAIVRKKKRLTIGSVGRLHPQKGFDTLLKSFQRVSESISEVKLEIVGRGAAEKQLKELARALKIDTKVTFLENIPNHLLPQKLQEWDLFVLASIWEGFGIVLVEAMAMEKAVVATRVGAIGEIVDDEKTGFLVSSEAPEAMACKIIELLNDRDRRIRMGQCGREKVLQQFSLLKNVKKLETIYDSLE